MEENLTWFLNGASSPYHAARCVKDILNDYAFENMDYLPKMTHQFTRLQVIVDGKAVIAIHNNNEGPIAQFSASFDTPALEFVNKPKVDNGICVECLKPKGETARWHTFLDRDLKYAGAIITNSKIHLIDSGKNVGIVPSLAVHFDPNIKLSPKFDANSTFGVLTGTVPMMDQFKKDLGIDSLEGAKFDVGFVDSMPANISNGIIASRGLSSYGHAFCAVAAFINYINQEGSPSAILSIDCDNLIPDLLKQLRPYSEYSSVLNTTKKYSFKPFIAHQPNHPETLTAENSSPAGTGKAVITSVSLNETHIGFPVMSMGSAREAADLNDVLETSKITLPAVKGKLVSSVSK